MVVINACHNGQRNLSILRFDATQDHVAASVDENEGFSSGQEPESAYSGDSGQAFRSKIGLTVVLGPTMAQLERTRDEGFKLLGREGSKRRCGGPERRILFVRLFELIDPDVSVMYGLVEGLTSLRRPKGVFFSKNEEKTRALGGLTTPARTISMASRSRKTSSRMSRGSDGRFMGDERVRVNHCARCGPIRALVLVHT